jgi:signal transduction histidine kinase
MKSFVTAIQWLQLVEWTVLAVVALNVWRVRRTPAARWLAFTFGILALVVLAGHFMSKPEGAVEASGLVRALLVALVLFPYLLYRFVVAMVERHRWSWILAHVLTAATIVATFLISSFPASGEPRSAAFQAFLLLFLAQWSFLLVFSAWRLWRAAVGQATVASKRMRTMAIGSLTLAVVLIVSAFAPGNAEPHGGQIAILLAGLLSGPFFLCGFSPPRSLRVQWRSTEEKALRQMEIGLVGRLSRSEIADAWLPRVAALVGGTGAALFDADRSVLATHDLSRDEAERIACQFPSDALHYEPVAHGSWQVLAMDNGWLLVAIGPLTPFFGVDELQMLSASAVVADLALAQAKLFELERQSRDAMRDFVAIASHDLRTPLTVIHGFVQLLSQQWDGFPDEEKKKFLSTIERQVGHLDRLVDDLLTVSTLDVKEIHVLRQPVDVAGIVKEVVSALGTEPAIEIASSGGSVACADPEHVARIVQNYVTNATIYGRPPYSLEVVGNDGWVTVRMRDTGDGVGEDFLPRLYEKFARGNKKKDNAIQGTGLGLSIVRGLARANGGEAWYEDNVPAGACFVLRLPAAERAAAEESHG